MRRIISFLMVACNEEIRKRAERVLARIAAKGGRIAASGGLKFDEPQP